MGAGYTGLSAARETAAAGRSTLVLEAGAIGAGCSGRNGGQVAYSLKPSLVTLSARYGEKRAYAICREGRAALDYLRALATSGGVDCDWRQRGCFYGAHTPRHFRIMARDAQHQTRGLEQRITVVPRAQQRQELASDFYHGGCVYHDDASVDPMRLLLALLRRAEDSGAAIADHCAAQAIRRSHAGFEVSTSRGIVKARRVLIATNGYSGNLSPWHRRRVIPIGSYQIATEPLGRDRVSSLIPAGRNIVDSQADRRVFPALCRRRAHHLRRPSGAGRKGSARLRAPIADDDDPDFSATARGSDHACVGRVGGVYIRYHAASRRAATACSTAWAIADRASRSLLTSARRSDSKWRISPRDVPRSTICRSHRGSIIVALRGSWLLRCGHIAPSMGSASRQNGSLQRL